MIIGLFGVAMSSNNDEISVYINGERVEFDVPPQIIDNRTMVPVRNMFEALGAEVEWRENTQSITAVKGRIAIVMQIGRYQMDIFIYPDEERTPIPISPWEIPLDAPPIIVDNRTLMPLRAVTEGLDADVVWDEENRAVIITNFSWEEIAPWNRRRI